MAAPLERMMLQSTELARSTLAKPAGRFSFEEFFRGHTRASGWFADRFGKPRRHFCGDFYGANENDSFCLDEKLYYTDGVVEERQWIVQVSKDGVFTAQSESLVDGAEGFIHGNTLFMKYSMKVMVDEGKYWDLDMKDLMVLQPDGSVHNVNHVFKWGIRIGTVSAHYSKHDGSQLCTSVQGAESAKRSTTLVSV